MEMTLIIDGMPVRCVTDPDGRLAAWNARFEKHLATVKRLRQNAARLERKRRRRKGGK